MKRRVFYSFHYKPDNWRASMVRNVGTIEGNRPATDNAWETVKKGGDLAIKRWINRQMAGRTCAVVLVGSNTANRKWINYEIAKAWADGLGVVGICVHGLKDPSGISSRGPNPFDFVPLKPYSRTRLSTIIKCYNPGGRNSKERYAWISEHLANAVEEAIRIRKDHES